MAVTFTWTLAPPAPAGLLIGSPVFSGEGEAAAPDFGFDVLVLPDLDTSFTPRRDTAAVADAFARRLSTPRGTLWDDPNYGFDIRDFLNDEVTPGLLAAIRSGIEAQAEQDERIFACTASVEYELSTETLRIRARLLADAGPFGMVFEVSTLATNILVEA